MQLSRKGWNNVLIFSMLLMIFFFNGLDKKLNSEPGEQGNQTVLPPQSFILALSFPEIKIERIGTAWRAQELTHQQSTKSWAASEQQMNDLVVNWQTINLPITTSKVNISALNPLYVATVWLAGEQLPYAYQLYFDGQNYYLLDKHLQRIFTLTKPVVEQLFPLIEITQSEPDA